MAQIIKGNEIAKQITDKIKLEVELLERKPKLAVVLVGDDFSSEAYVRGKVKAGARVGIEVDIIRFSEDIEETLVLDKIENLNKDDNVDGIIVQLPLPKHLDEIKILNTVSVYKDVDGFSYYNAGRLFRGNPLLTPCTPQGVIYMLEAMNVNLSGLNAVVVGRSNLVGLPMARLLVEKDATVTLCHSKTKDLKEFTAKADLLVVAIGQSKFVKKEYIKEGAIIIDVGISRDENNKLSGDVDFDDVFDKAGMISPVPKGVGPLTVAMLLSNTLKAYKGEYHE